MRIGATRSGRTVFGTPFSVALLVTMLTGIAALRLDDRRDLPAARPRVAVEGQLLRRAQDETMARIEVGEAVLVGDVIAVLDVEVRGVERVGVERLRPGVRACRRAARATTAWRRPSDSA